MNPWQKRQVQVGQARVADVDAGDGPPLLLLHGCPFSSHVWRQVVPLLRGRFRCIAPDLLGLGDTETSPGADWSLPAQAAMVVGQLDALSLDAAHVVGRDHGAATAQFLAGQLDPANNRATADAAAGLRSFGHPTLILWGRDDPHIGPEWAQRLHDEIAGAVRVELFDGR